MGVQRTPLQGWIAAQYNSICPVGRGTPGNTPVHLRPFLCASFKIWKALHFVETVENFSWIACDASASKALAKMRTALAKVSSRAGRCLLSARFSNFSIIPKKRTDRPNFSTFRVAKKWSASVESPSIRIHWLSTDNRGTQPDSDVPSGL